MKVLVVPNYSRSDAVADAHRLDSWLGSRGCECTVMGEAGIGTIPDFDVTEYGLVVSLGGDGTLLRAARIIGYSQVPLIGISYGHLGFLTSAVPGDMITAVSDALSGNMHVSHRATLDVEAEFNWPDGTYKAFNQFALNEVSITRGIRGDIIEFDVSVSGNYIDRLRGDGFIVSTATGSTGYALAAGGPIVTPEFSGMVCVPLAPHTIMARAFLTADTDEVEITMSQQRPAERLVFVDGRPLGEGGVLRRATVRRGKGDILLLDYSDKGFYGSVSRVFYGKAGERR